MKKILSIDGGGIKGVFPASFLASVDDAIDNKISDYFDLIVGTSTGGIIALGLGLGMSAQDILSFYEEWGPNIFTGSSILKKVKSIIAPMYNQAPLRNALNKTFQKQRLGDSIKRLVIPSLNLETGEVHIYKTSHNQRLEKDYMELAVDVALATAAAPTYFPTFHAKCGIPLVDGGIWANNPVEVAVIEAVTILKWPVDSIKVLSLGCTTEPLNVSKKKGIKLMLKIADVFMTAQSSAALSSAQLLIGKPNVYRISPVVSSGRFSLDGANEIMSLKGLGSSEARKALPHLKENFFECRAEPFDPYYKL